MRYEILGPLRVTDGGRSYFISAKKVEMVLAVLLIRTGQVVTIDQLIAEIWGSNVPRRATAGIHVYVSQLRKFMNRHGHGGSSVITRAPGYQLRLETDDFDFHSFQHLADLGRDHARRQSHEEAAAFLAKALLLWRGPVLGGARQGPIVEGFVAWLEESRMECIEMLMNSRLILGRHRELIGELYSLIAEYPLREVFYRQLMLALYRSQRQADALQVYQSARRMLNEELGLEPCRGLQDLQRAILTADGQLDVCAV